MNTLPDDEIYFFEKTDGQLARMYKKNDELWIVVPGERFSCFGIVVPFAVALFLVYWWGGWTVITYFTEVIFEPAVPLWFKILLFPVYFTLLCIGLFVFIGAFWECFSRREFIFCGNELIVKKTLFYLFRFVKRFALSDVNCVYESTQSEHQQENNEYNLVLSIKTVQYGIDLCKIKHTESKNLLIQTVHSFLVNAEYQNEER